MTSAIAVQSGCAVKMTIGLESIKEECGSSSSQAGRPGDSPGPLTPSPGVGAAACPLFSGPVVSPLHFSHVHVIAQQSTRSHGPTGISCGGTPVHAPFGPRTMPHTPGSGGHLPRTLGPLCSALPGEVPHSQEALTLQDEGGPQQCQRHPDPPGSGAVRRRLRCRPARVHHRLVPLCQPGGCSAGRHPESPPR